MMHQRAVIFVLLLWVGAAAGDPPATIFWQRALPGVERSVWVYGRELWDGPEHVTSSSARAVIRLTASTGGGVTDLAVDDLTGANGHDPNRALDYVQRYLIPSSLAAGDYALAWRRNDQTTFRSLGLVTIPAIDPTPANGVVAQVIQTVSAPIVVPANTIHDLEGGTFSPAADFPSGRTMYTIESGATLRNGTIYLPAGSPAAVAVALRSSAAGVRLDGLNILVEDRGKTAVMVRAAEWSVFSNLRVVASRCFDAISNDRQKDNSFSNIDCSSPRGIFDGQVGRGVGGARSLLFRFCWHDIDRGPTLSSQGSPLEAICLFECAQRDTGGSEGASEGYLVETKKVVATNGVADESGYRLIGYLADDRGIPYLVPGYWFFCAQTQQAHKITAVTPLPQDEWEITLAEPVPAGQVSGFVGNGFVHGAILRSEFARGRSGIWLWGVHANSVVVGNDFRSLDFGIGLLDRAIGTGDYGFSWKFTEKHNRFRGVAEPVRVLQ